VKIADLQALAKNEDKDFVSNFRDALKSLKGGSVDWGFQIVLVSELKTKPVANAAPAFMHLSALPPHKQPASKNGI